MTEIFKSETFAVFMQQILDEPTLPMLFLRTVIQAVIAYKSLIPYVSTTLLSRLITKKIWTITALWDGFIRCAKQTAPSSYATILQLPKDQVKDLLTREPKLKPGLRDFITKSKL